MKFNDVIGILDTGQRVTFTFFVARDAINVIMSQSATSYGAFRYRIFAKEVLFCDARYFVKEPNFLSKCFMIIR